jgi:glycosyltransferase involved in cell wall biosynthesis
MPMLTCTICVIAYNEEKSIRTILDCISCQDYDHSLCEVILVDGMSTDNTKAIMKGFDYTNAIAAKPFKRVCVLDNPGKTLPAGWNVALKEYQSDVIIKVDAHAEIPKDFVSKNIRVLESGEYICGGLRPTVLEETTPWNETLLLAENSMFGSSIAPYRNNPGKTYVKSLFHGAYRREVFDRVGGFNEELVRTEDNEIHYRMRKAGFKLRFDPQIVSYQHIRSSFVRMLRQKYENGYWVGVTAKKCPECLEKYHFVPFAFVSAIALSSAGLLVTGLFKNIRVVQRFRNVIKFLTGLMWRLYGTLSVVMSVMASFKAGKKRNITNAALPALFLSLHVAYGAGTFMGLLGKRMK